MRIVNLEEFRKLPEMTVFRKFRPMVTDDLMFKGETWEHDFISMSVDMPENNGSEHLFDRLSEMEETGVSYPLEVDGWGRDGLFDKEQMFLIYEHADLVALNALIDKAVSVAATPTQQG